MFKKYSFTFIGLLFTSGGILSSFTIVTPVLLIGMPGAMLETFFRIFLGDAAPFDKIGTAIIFLLLGLFVLTSTGFVSIMLEQIKKEGKMNKGPFILYMIFQVIILPTLAMYLITSTNWGMAHDGQYIFVTAEALPLGSIPFVFLGLISDLIKFKAIKKFEARASL